MAKHKKAFVAYADWETTFEKLSDEEAGKLVKIIFSYVNDKNPTAPDRLTDLLFEPIKNQLKRDLKSYEEKLEEQSRKGRLGNLKRWNSDLYDLVISNSLQLEEAEEIAKHRQSDNNIATAIKTSPNIADKDTVTDTVIDTDKDILLKKETKDDVGDFENSEEIEKVKKVLKSSPITNDRLMMQHKISKENLLEKIDEFVDKKFSWEENTWKNEGDLKKNFEFWLSSNVYVVVNNYKKWTKEEFFKEIVDAGPKVAKNLKQEFFDIYKQPTEDGKMRFQNHSAWDTKTQLKMFIENKKSKYAS